MDRHVPARTVARVRTRAWARTAGSGAVALVAVFALGIATAEPGVPAPYTRAFPAVGVLMANGEHWCTASVVDSPRGNVVATAAHCVAPAGEDGEEGQVAQDGLAIGVLSFAPGFSGKDPGRHPSGVWKVASVHVDERWTRYGDETADYAFLTIAPDATGRTVEQVVGRGVVPEPDWSPGPEREVTVVGYPEPDHNPDNRPVACTTRTEPDDEDPKMLYINCPGFWTGTSGSPWVADRGGPGRPGRLIGVLSGGDTDADSTAAPFDARARRLYEAAAAGRTEGPPTRGS
ncbi:trypsin-like serine peptidase [Streptomyces sp. NPDC093225]|uniref:trypsin-like serine peptidase n=1 Tax=Streptomyces sp. NPDC093225 TaxID=3366034 RepID=UPI0038071086